MLARLHAASCSDERLITQSASSKRQRACWKLSHVDSSRSRRPSSVSRASRPFAKPAPLPLTGKRGNPHARAEGPSRGRGRRGPSRVCSSQDGPRAAFSPSTPLPERAAYAQNVDACAPKPSGRRDGSPSELSFACGEWARAPARTLLARREG
ncbi:hypothetical protein BD413DRAFT_502927 [Trametes elegans]|nr:hypothetical protein BD413DRAFT_502927 [Trametes elegans]